MNRGFAKGYQLAPLVGARPAPGPSRPGLGAGGRESLLPLDRTNLALLDLLQKDARTTIIDLARAVGRAETTVRERLAALERLDVLRGYRAVVDPAALGLGVRAFLRAPCDRRNVEELARRLGAIPNVLGAYLTTAEDALVVDIVAEDLERMEALLEERFAPLGLDGVRPEIVLRPLVEARPLPLTALAAPAEARPTNGTKNGHPPNGHHGEELSLLSP